ncbi:hypothetical protein B296_00035819 [Ensete ventricosum]|uniref:Uncharacterized protein n=1 Tax=Ensete ventricosum TaxID=4639 RepID=A0A426ZQS0_ENSVE|nr:hypothetical protein B296_00035819 [Ensete ventricosum]
MSSTPNRGHMLIIGADTSRVGIGIALMQDDQLLIRIKDFPIFYMRCLKEILIATKLKVWLCTDDSAEILPIDTQADEEL